METGGSRERIAARNLLLRVFDEAQPDAFDLVIAHEALGELYESEGAFDEAEAQYRVALHLSLESNVSGDAHLRLPELLIRSGDVTKYADAEAIVARIDWEDLAFSSQRFRYAVCRARLAAARGDSEEASEYAAAALREAARETPDFPRHPNVGQVHVEPSLLREMEQLRQVQ